MTARRLTEEEAWEARKYWASGLDTFDIAQILGVSESSVANSIPDIREPVPLRESEPAKETPQ